MVLGCFRSFYVVLAYSSYGFSSFWMVLGCFRLFLTLVSIPQGSVLGSLLFLLYINDLNQAIKICKVNHFAGDTNLLCLSNSIKKLNIKLINAELMQIKFHLM